MGLGSLTYNNNIDKMYYHFTTTHSTTIRKFSNETSYKKNSRTSNPWYDKKCKIARKRSEMLLMKSLSSRI